MRCMSLAMNCDSHGIERLYRKMSKEHLRLTIPKVRDCRDLNLVLHADNIDQNWYSWAACSFVVWFVL